MSIATILPQLQQSRLFADIPEAALNHFAEKSSLRRHDKGKVLFLQGDEASWFYIVVQGWVKLFRETLEGSEAVIDVVTTGDIFGQHTIFDNELHSFGAEIVDDTVYIAIPTSLLRFYVEKHQSMALNLLASMSRHQTLHHREIEHLNVQNAPQRIGCFLLRLCPTDIHSQIQLNLPYDKTLIAARLGMKPETFSRALARLKADTHIIINGSAVTIPALSKLVHYTCNHCSHSFPCDDGE